MKWASDVPNPTAELQAMKSVLEEPKKIKGGKKRQTVSFGGTARTRAINAATAAAAAAAALTADT